MLNFQCFFVLFNAVKTDKKLTLHHIGFFFYYYLTYQDKILNLEGYIFEKFFTIKMFLDGLPVFAQQTIYHVRNGMRQSLMISFTGSYLRLRRLIFCIKYFIWKLFVQYTM